MQLQHSDQDSRQNFNPTSTASKLTCFASNNSGGFSLNSILKRCESCEGKGAVECVGCKGTGRNKKNGNIFERWKHSRECQIPNVNSSVCFDCQGFGMKKCPSCGKGGLTPEQRGER